MNKLKVTLLMSTKEDNISECAKVCYSSKLIKDGGKDITKSLVHGSGHLAVLRFAYATVNVKGISVACFDKNHEVLTKRGWLPFEDTTSHDYFATFDIATNKMVFQKRTDYIEYKYEGTMHSYNQIGYSMNITANHKLLERSAYSKDKTYKLTPSEDISTKAFKAPKLLYYHNTVDDTVKIKGYSYDRNSKSGKFTKVVEDMTFPKGEFTEFIALYLAEGSVYKRAGDESYVVSISQKDKKHKKYMFDLIIRLGISPSMDKNEIKFSSQCLGRFLKSLGTSNVKCFPFNEFDYFDKQTARLFLSMYLKTDGHKDKNGINSFYTTSKTLSDTIYNIILIAGYAASGYINSSNVGKEFTINGKTYKSNFPVYTLRYSDKNVKNVEAYVKIKNRKEYEYSGIVRCVTVPNGTIFVRQKNMFNAVWVGNCQNQVVRSKHLDFMVQSKRYVKKSKFDFIMPSGLSKDQENMMNDAWNYVSVIYDELISDGVKKEDARAVLPANTSTEMNITGNLQAWHDFFKLRMTNHAQLEIRLLTEEIYSVLSKEFPQVFTDELKKTLYKADYNKCKKDI